MHMSLNMGADAKTRITDVCRVADRIGAVLFPRCATHPEIKVALIGRPHWVSDVVPIWPSLVLMIQRDSIPGTDAVEANDWWSAHAL